MLKFFIMFIICCLRHFD